MLKRLLLTSSAALMLPFAAAAQNVVTMNTVQIFGTIDPAKISDYTDYMAAVNLYDGLVTVDSEGNLVPQLAESWVVADDASSVTFTLRADAHFSDGSPVEAKDVIYSFERLLRINQGPANLFDGVVEPGNVIANDDGTVTFNLSRPFAPFMATVPALMIVNSDVVAENAGDDDAQAWLGGGSHVLEDGAKVGPTSVGYELLTQALVFGGDVLTATDVVVADGGIELGDPARVAGLDPAIVRRARERIADMLEDAVERARLSPEPLPVIVVGGGSIIVGGPIAGLELIKPDHFPVANAVGAAIAQVSGEVDRVYSLAEMSRDAALDDAKAQATDAAVAAGARRDSVEIVDVEDVPLAYLPGNATRVRVKAVGELNV